MSVPVDMLEWFDPEERSRCDACETDSCVTLDPTVVRICLRCGAVWAADGQRMDVEGAIPAAGAGG